MQKLKDGLSIAREVILIAVFIGLLLFPGWINDRLVRAGFTKGTVAGFEWQAQIEKSKEDVQKAGQTVDQVQQKLEEVSSTLAGMSQSNQSTANTQQLDALTTTINESREDIRKVDMNLKESLIRQEAIIQQVKETPRRSIGWIFLGKVTETKDRWVDGRPKTIDPIDPTNLEGKTLTIIDNVYLREDTDDTFKTSARVLSVVEAGERVKVISPYHSKAKGGGYFLWVKVERME